MHFFSLTSSLALVSLALGTPAPPKTIVVKPVLCPAIDFRKMNTILTAVLPKTPHKIKTWPWGQMPKTCMSQTERLKLDPYEMKVHEILYEDCPRPWYVCRHETAEMSIEAIAENFGRLPVGLRDFVRYQFATAPRNGAAGGTVILPRGDVTYWGNLTDYQSTFVHEAVHAAEYYRGYEKHGGLYAESKHWMDEYNKDDWRSDDKSAKSSVEAFAQMGILALIDKHLPAGLTIFEPNFKLLSHQHNALLNLIGDTLDFGTTCNRREPDDEPIVCMGPKVDCENMPNLKFIPPEESLDPTYFGRWRSGSVTGC
ncbi:uncharacterized protein B0J16DRAFT_404456 [Fusarium flagelliforme]|uniref:uncharacterized protein n=1 Tax=Fusarium flagelliforme TaxID=2675880 RepID=UPI001E8DA7CF|nr:uncharacterized protein B0J16DRAFT_404456 [Fusarium flagelliforme]KAH7174699.1 hypothetical protein B0J16DRAFT_404456 [Fusarium flagelliforme]